MTANLRAIAVGRVQACACAGTCHRAHNFRRAAVCRYARARARAGVGAACGCGVRVRRAGAACLLLVLTLRVHAVLPAAAFAVARTYRRQSGVESVRIELA
eukprot:573722-Pleurochrysis_carterae.AAC.1